MRIYMQTPVGEDAAPRYYHLHLQEDLLEGWTLVRESGRQGSSGLRRRLARANEAGDANGPARWT